MFVGTNQAFNQASPNSEIAFKNRPCIFTVKIGALHNYGYDCTMCVLRVHLKIANCGRPDRAQKGVGRMSVHCTLCRVYFAQCADCAVHSGHCTGILCKQTGKLPALDDALAS